MKRSLRGLWIFVFALCIAGCAHGTPYTDYTKALQPLQPDKARILIYRGRSAMMMLVKAGISVNLRQRGFCSNGSFFYVDVEPGSAEIEARAENFMMNWSMTVGSYVLKLPVEAGKTYYVRVAPRGAFMGITMMSGSVGALIDSAVAEDKSGAFTLTVVDESAAKASIGHLCYSRD